MLQRGLLLAALAMLGAGTAAAQSTAQCRTIADERARLQCYDALANQPPHPITNQGNAATTNSVVTPPLYPPTGGVSGGCGSRGGPGYRLANGRCASWQDYQRGLR